MQLMNSLKQTKIYNCGSLYEYYSKHYNDSLNFIPLGVDIIHNS